MSRHNNPWITACCQIAATSFSSTNCMVVPLVLDAVHPVLHNVPLLIMLISPSCPPRTPPGSCECTTISPRGLPLANCMAHGPDVTMSTIGTPSGCVRQPTAGACRAKRPTADNAAERGLLAMKQTEGRLATLFRLHLAARQRPPPSLGAAPGASVHIQNSGLLT